MMRNYMAMVVGVSRECVFVGKNVSLCELHVATMTADHKHTHTHHMNSNSLHAFTVRLPNKRRKTKIKQTIINDNNN